jgi:hypothetical protein
MKNTFPKIFRAGATIKVESFNFLVAKDKEYAILTSIKNENLLIRFSPSQSYEFQGPMGMLGSTHLSTKFPTSYSTDGGNQWSVYGLTDGTIYDLKNIVINQFKNK